MRARHLFALVTLALTAATAACEDDDGTGPDPDHEFAAAMNGANEKPAAVSPAGTGTATFTLNEAETSATWSVTATGMTSNINNAHIHLGNSSVAGGVIVQLGGFPTATSGTWSGTLDSSAALLLGLSWNSLIDLIRNGDAYVNVHTVNNPGGEIRGQLITVP